MIEEIDIRGTGVRSHRPTTGEAFGHLEDNLVSSPT